MGRRRQLSTRSSEYWISREESDLFMPKIAEHNAPCYKPIIRFIPTQILWMRRRRQLSTRSSDYWFSREESNLFIREWGILHPINLGSQDPLK